MIQMIPNLLDLQNGFQEYTTTTTGESTKICVDLSLLKEHFEILKAENLRLKTTCSSGNPYAKGRWDK